MLGALAFGAAVLAVAACVALTTAMASDAEGAAVGVGAKALSTAVATVADDGALGSLVLDEAAPCAEAVAEVSGGRWADLLDRSERLREIAHVERWVAAERSVRNGQNRSVERIRAHGDPTSQCRRDVRPSGTSSGATKSET